jgi:hypothetical protein
VLFIFCLTKTNVPFKTNLPLGTEDPAMAIRSLWYRYRLTLPSYFRVPSVYEPVPSVTEDPAVPIRSHPLHHLSQSSQAVPSMQVQYVKSYVPVPTVSPPIFRTSNVHDFFFIAEY